MQEQNASKVPTWLSRFGMKNLVGVSLFSILMLTVAITWLAPCRNLSTASWREAHQSFPWEQEGLCIEKLSARWVSSSGHERMALRAACYPVAEIELGEAEGSGMLYVRFADHNGHQAGDTIPLHYSMGSFRPLDEVNARTEGNKARVFVETGYDDASVFRLHQMDESFPLWRVSLFCRPDGTTELRPMGFVTIPATLEP